MKYSTIENKARSAPPPLGFHSFEVLSRVLNLNEEEVEQLRNEGAIL